MYIITILGVLILFLIIKILLKYEPQFDLVMSNNKFILLLWYNKYNKHNKKDIERTYIKLF